MPIVLPALRERRSDIPPLVSYFIQKFNTRLKKTVDGVEPEAMERLAGYGWPGNIRELENVIERAVLFADGSRIRLEDLAVELRDGPTSIDSGRGTPLPPAVNDGSAPIDGLKEQVKAAMSRLERDLILRALMQTQNNVTHAARLLKISRKGLQLKMKELNLRERVSSHSMADDAQKSGIREELAPQREKSPRP